MLLWDTGSLAWVRASASDFSGGAGGGMTDAQFAAHLPLSVGLATGAATSALQGTGNTSVASIDTKTPALGQALPQLPRRLCLRPIQQAALTPPAAITGFALEAGHLAAIDTSVAKIPSQGQALAAASLPVVLTAIQQTALTPPAAITGFALDATLTGGTQKSIQRGGAKGATAAADLTGTAQGADHQSLDVQIYHGGAAKDPTQIRALTTADAITATLAAASDATKLEDAGANTGDRGIFILAVRNDLLSTPASADADYSQLSVDSAGRVHTREINNLYATNLSGANASVTLTINAAAAGLFHYITSIEIVNVNPTAAAIAGSAVTLGYTSTNIPGSPAWTAGNALAAGAEKVVARITYPGAIKTTTAATNTTIVAPAIGAGGLCRITVTYYIAP
jgi:hypothetical protein